MATSLSQSPRQCLPPVSKRNCVSEGTGSRRSMMSCSFGKRIPPMRLICSSGQSRFLRLVEQEHHRRARLAATPNDEKEESSISESSEVVDEKNVNNESEKKGFVENIEEEMGRQFGGFLWFTVLLVCLAVFGGAYVYDIVNFANFDDIPILKGPAR